MFDTCKYIVFSRKDVGYPDFIIFSWLHKHCDMAQTMGLSQSEILSAGFVKTCADKIVCFGKAQSLGVVSKEDEDSKLINRLMGNE